MSKSILPDGYYMLDKEEHCTLSSLDNLTNYCCLTENGEKLFEHNTTYTFFGGSFSSFSRPYDILKAEDALDLENWDWVMDDRRSASTKEKDMYRQIGENIKEFCLGLPKSFTVDMHVELVKEMIKSGEGFGSPGIEKIRSFYSNCGVV